MTDIYDVQRFAIQAKSLLEDPAFRRVYEKLYMGAVDAFRRSLPEEVERREQAYWRLQALEELDQTLHVEMHAAKLAEKREQARQ